MSFISWIAIFFLSINLWAFIFGFIFKKWLTKDNDYFRRRNLPYEKPKVPDNKSPFNAMCDLYEKYNGNRVFGIFENQKPVYIVRDPQLIKQIMIKDFDHFMNRTVFTGELGCESLLNKSIFSMHNENWHEMRKVLSPMFTGNKLKEMFALISDVIEADIKYLQTEEIKNIEILSKIPYEDLDYLQRIELENYEAGTDIKNLTNRLTSDIIASLAFGVSTNSLQDKENEFYKKAKQSQECTQWQYFKIISMLIMPKISSCLKVDPFDRTCAKYFLNLILNGIKSRKESKMQRPDMLQLLMQIHDTQSESNDRKWSDIEVAAQSYVFIQAGLEPAATLMIFVAHELVKSPEIQEKLYAEISAIDSELNQSESLSYEALQNATYLDMVVLETLRKWPPTLAVDRVCTKNFHFKWENGEEIKFQYGETVRVLTSGLHRDENNFESPLKFDPERFNKQNKMKIDGSAYMPFGLGPRNCMGNQLALLMVKAFLFYLLRAYKLQPSPRTFQIDAVTKNVELQTGYWIRLKSR